MIKYYKKVSFLKIQESYYDGRLGLPDLFSLKVIYHLKTDKKMIGVKQLRATLEMDLEQQDKDAIFAGFSKAYRQQIRKAEEDGIVVEETNDMQAFVDFFNEFAVKKGTYATSIERLSEKKHALVMSFAKHNDTVIAAQSFLVDKDLKIVRHYQTANKRFDDNLNKNFVGQANKYLLVTNLLKFKDEGYKIFDFGGYAINTTDESLLGINNYKLKFGGHVVDSTNYYSLLYWLLKTIGKKLGRSGDI